MAPYGGADAVQDTNQKLLAQLIDKDVFNRMAEAATFPGAVGTYQGADLLRDLNDGLFSELKQARPVIDFIGAIFSAATSISCCRASRQRWPPASSGWLCGPDRLI